MCTLDMCIFIFNIVQCLPLDESLFKFMYVSFFLPRSPFFFITLPLFFYRAHLFFFHVKNCHRSLQCVQIVHGSNKTIFAITTSIGPYSLSSYTNNRTMSVVTRSLTFAYPNSTQGLHNIDLTLPLGGKILLVGPNGAGKSTLLKILAGKKLISSGEIELFGIEPFNLRENWKLNEKNIVYLGTEWANNEIVKRDIGVHELVESVGGSHFPERRALLIDILEIDVNWRMNKCSDGERRRVQLAMGLLKPFDLLLLDEVTIDLDVLVRQKLLNFLYDETTTRNASIIYATHIFDGLGTWPDTVIHLNRGEIAESHNRNNISFTNTPGVAQNGLQLLIGRVSSLYPLALSWLQKDRE